MSRISKLFTGLCTAALFMIILAAPVKADLASDAAWVQAQAQAGLKSAQAALDAAYATGVKDAAWVKAQQAAGMAAGLAHQQDIANQAAAGMASGQAALNAFYATGVNGVACVKAQQAAGAASGMAYLQAIAAKTASDAAWVAAQAAAGMH